MKKIIQIFIIISFLTITFAHALEKTDQIRIHVMNCGQIETKELDFFSDTGEYDGKTGTLADPCFLIQHPKGLLLWDTGLGDSLLGKAPIENGPFKLSVSTSLEGQLKKLGVDRKDVTYISFSHIHFDHTGNANLFTNSTWIWQEKELTYAEQKKSGPGVKPASLSQYTKVKKLVIQGDHDVFSDGKVKILSTPGHTPGHQSLLVKLESGPVILSGDLYHLKANRDHQRMPAVNFSRAETLASINRIETLAKFLNARVIVQHDPEDFASLPLVPSGYLH